MWDALELAIITTMSVWEYKVITSGKGGFATPALLESFLNQLGKDEWEIIHFHAQADNALAFSGLARRSTQRDWTLEDAAAAAARAEADKLRAEFEAKFKGLAGGASPADEKPESIAAEQAGSDDGLRKLRDTESDLDPDAPDEEEADEWDKLAKEDDLPTFFEAIQPLMRRNQRGSGQSAGVDHLAKKWGMTEKEVVGALKECGFAIPEDEDDPPAYIEYDGDLYWVNVNRRGELWINTKEKPRPVFRIVPGTQVSAEEGSGNEGKPKPPRESHAPRGGAERPAEAEQAGDADRPSERESRPDRQPENRGPKSAQLPEGPALLEKIRPLMRRNRDGSGASGSTSFLSRALRCREAELTAAFSALGLSLPPGRGQPPAEVEISGRVWSLNKDHRGGIWINERDEKRNAEPASAPAEGEQAGGEPEAAPQAESAPRPVQHEQGGASDSALAGVRLLLKETRTGAVAGETARLAETLGKTPEEFVAGLVAAGLKVPEKTKEKPVFVEHAGEIFWLNRNAKGQLWLNAKASKFAAPKPESGPPAEKKPRPGRIRRAATADEPS